MPVELARLAQDLEPERTVLFFGAGASVPSNAPSVDKLLEVLEAKFFEPKLDYSLREYTGILEGKYTRKALIETLQQLFECLRPTGSLLNLPYYPWKSIFTTNYDTLIEQCYEKRQIPLTIYNSNFDFTIHSNQDSTKLFKLHGTIEKDVSLGHHSRIILTDSDYDNTQSFREALYDRLSSDIHGASLVIIGHSLADEDIKAIADRAASISAKAGGISKIVLLMYSEDINRAQLWERRGIQVCFGGLDQFFSAISNKMLATATVHSDSEQAIDVAPSLLPKTIDVTHAITCETSLESMFNGWPAKYSDIHSELTFRRVVSTGVIKYLEKEEALVAVILGPSGTGKTTAARQVLVKLQSKGTQCWEHKRDFGLQVNEWLLVAQRLVTLGKKGVLFVDEAHAHLHELNELLDALQSRRETSLKVIAATSRNHWNPRIKSTVFYRSGREFSMGKLAADEIDQLLNLVDSNQKVKTLVGEDFSGFSRYEMRRRLVERCNSETFVCLKNIFSTEQFDDIILREFSALDLEVQEIYRLVAAMENSGIRVHRQLVIRLLGIPAQEIGIALSKLIDIVIEYSINEREGIYGWRGRHSVIVAILTKYKFHDIDQIVDLFDRVIDSISPTFDIEVRTIREMCNLETGLSRIPDKTIQNRLLGKMISIAPGERVPRHRLIRNLIDMGEFDRAETEIRIFEKDFGHDVPVIRYRIMLLMRRAIESPGLMQEDRIAILHEAKDKALQTINRIPEHKLVLSTYADVGVELSRLCADYSVFDDAIRLLKQAEQNIGDPEISNIIRKKERLIAGQVFINESNESSQLEVDSEIS